jgi:hypothetical protein
VNVVTMPTTRSNSEALARACGYSIEIRRAGSIVVKTTDGQIVHRADRWSEVLRFLVAAPRIEGGDGPDAA